MPIGYTSAVEIQFIKDSQGVRGETIAATFVAGKSGFVDDGDIVAEAMQGGGTCGP